METILMAFVWIIVGAFVAEIVLPILLLIIVFLVALFKPTIRK